MTRDDGMFWNSNKLLQIPARLIGDVFFLINYIPIYFTAYSHPQTALVREVTYII